MGRKFNFDYIVIGSGPAGTATALILAKNKKKKVAIVEGGKYGGSNLNTRDIPYLISLNFVHNFHNLKGAPELSGQVLHYNFPTISSHQGKIARSLGANNKKLYTDANLTCIDGFANFLDKNTIAVGDKKFTSRYFVLATGSKLNTTDIVGLDSASYHTPDTIIKIRRLPKFILIVGGGSTGCEIAEYFAKLGTKVIIMESNSRILPKEDKEASESLRDYFEHKLDIIVMENCKVVEITNEKNAKRVVFSTGEHEKMVRIDCVILATGSTPCVNYGLENAGVKFNKSGILVNKFFQTSARNIFAVGDCIGHDSSTERAESEALALTNNLMHRSKISISPNKFIRVTATEPGIATIGKAEATLQKNKIKYKKSIVYLKDIPASKIYNQPYGFVKLLADRNNRLVGATIMAPDISAIASELALAVHNQLTASEIATIPHPTNSFSYAIELAAKKL